MRDEMQFHVDAYAADLMRDGLSRHDAYRRARREFGLVGTAENDCRRAKGLQLLDDFCQDVRHAARVLAKAPGFTVVAVVILAVGIGATTAIYSLANWTLFRPVPGATDPHDVRLVWSGRWTERRSFTVSFVSYPNYLDIVERLKPLAAFAGYYANSVSLATEREPARMIEAHHIGTDYFAVLGVRLRIGRTFTAEECAYGAANVAIISEALWASAFGRDEDVLQRQVRINDVPFVIVGVTANGFRGPRRVANIDMFLPAAVAPTVDHRKGNWRDRAGDGFYEFVTRRRTVVEWSQVERELAATAPWLVALYPDTNASFKEYGLHLFNPIGLGGLPTNGGRLRSLLAVMMGASALVLLIVCSNVAILLLMKGIGRQNEVAIRKALGANRWRLIRQHVTEGAILWFLGGAFGAVLVWLVTRLVNVAPFVEVRVPDAQVPIDWRVLLFTATVALFVGAVFSLPPALRAVRAEVGETLRATTPSAVSRRATVGAAFTSVQLAAALTLLIGALLLAASVRRLAAIPLGFEPSTVTTVFVDPARLGYSEAAAFQYARDFERRLAANPAVRGVAIARSAPFTGASYTRVRRHGAPEDDVQRTLVNEVTSASYFDTLGLSIQRGRGFDGSDIAQPGSRSRRVVVIDEHLASRLFGASEPIGSLIEMPVRGREGNTYEVIGIVAASRYSEVLGEPETIVYEPAGMEGPFRQSVTLLVRTDPSVSVAAEIRRIAHSLDSALPVLIRPLQQQLATKLADWTTLAASMNGLAAVATLLAAIGLYGVVAFDVVQRRREFGVRVALGATPRSILILVLRGVLIVAVVGLLAGLAGAVALTRSIESRLVGVDRFEPFSWAAAAAGLIAVVLLASLMPMRRAMRGDVTQALRTL